jgi:hypothetical protein
MRGEARGAYMPARHHVKTLETASSSRPNSETLVAHEVLAYPRMTSHPCTCGLRGSTTVVTVALIGYDDMEVAAIMTIRRRQS